MTIKVSREDIAELTYSSTDEYEHLSCEETGESRWDVFKTIVFKDKLTNKIYGFDYSEGKTEIQDYWSIDDEPEIITCREMVGKSVVVIQYEYVEG